MSYSLLTATNWCKFWCYQLGILAKHGLPCGMLDAILKKDASFVLHFCFPFGPINHVDKEGEKLYIGFCMCSDFIVSMVTFPCTFIFLCLKLIFTSNSM